MTIDLLGISFDAHNPSQLAIFWAQALHRNIADGATEQFAAIAADDEPALGTPLRTERPRSDVTTNSRRLSRRSAPANMTDAARLYCRDRRSADRGLLLATPR